MFEFNMSVTTVVANNVSSENKDFLIKNNDSCSRRFNRLAFMNLLIMHPPFSCIE